LRATCCLQRVWLQYTIPYCMGLPLGPVAHVVGAVVDSVLPFQALLSLHFLENQSYVVTQLLHLQDSWVPSVHSCCHNGSHHLGVCLPSAFWLWPHSSWNDLQERADAVLSALMVLGCDVIFLEALAQWPVVSSYSWNSSARLGWSGHCEGGTVVWRDT
jgi:hypothetical protein